jgi:tRNA threonylcarbamoyladenosine biosynthesis protein TsaE
VTESGQNQHFKQEHTGFEMNCLRQSAKRKGVVRGAIFQKREALSAHQAVFSCMVPKIFPVASLADLPDAATQVHAAIAETGCTVIAFEGEMGAGKTTLISALAATLGMADDVSSPTFALVNEYRDGHGRPVYHFDFYRIESLDEAERMGATEYLDSGYLCLVEWPARVAALLPTPRLEVRIDVLSAESREIHLTVIA